MMRPAITAIIALKLTCKNKYSERASPGVAFNLAHALFIQHFKINAGTNIFDVRELPLSSINK